METVRRTLARVYPPTGRHGRDLDPRTIHTRGVA